MQRLRQRALRQAGVILLVALVLLPAVLRSHWHADHGAGALPCAVCVVAHHSPATSAPVLVAIAPVFHGLAAAPPDLIAPARHDRPAKAGRAPPPLVTARVA